MPQLAIETFVSQYFWFIVILLSFYFIAITQVIPRIAEIKKTREKCASFISESQDNTNTVNIEDNKENNHILSVYKNISLGNRGLDTLVVDSNNDELIKATESWIKKNI